MKKNIIIIILLIIIVVLSIIIGFKYINYDNKEYLTKKVKTTTKEEYNENFNNINIYLKQEIGIVNKLLSLKINDNDITNIIQGTYIKSYEIYDKYVIIQTSDPSFSNLMFYNTKTNVFELVLDLDNLDEYLSRGYYTDKDYIYINAKYCSLMCGNPEKEYSYATYRIYYDGNKLNKPKKINEYN